MPPPNRNWAVGEIQVYPACEMVGRVGVVSYDQRIKSILDSFSKILQNFLEKQENRQGPNPNPYGILQATDPTGTLALVPQIVSALAILVIAPSRLALSPGGCLEMNAIVATAARILRGFL